MTTNEFIKMLQEADPTGEHHIRMEGGVPIYAELIAGYYDGAYDYIDDNGCWVRSTKDAKVDIYCRDISEFVLNLTDVNKSWEHIEEKIKFDMEDYAHHNQKKESFLETAKNYHIKFKAIKDKLFQEGLEQALQRINNGWKFYQDKQVDTNKHFTYYQWKIYNKDKNEWKSSSLGDTEAIIKSGNFERIDNNEQPDFYQWILKQD